MTVPSGYENREAFPVPMPDLFANNCATPKQIRNIETICDEQKISLNPCTSKEVGSFIL
jgi:hypothetical protein